MAGTVEAASKPVIEAIRWDAAAATFVRLMLDPCGRILGRRDLEPAEKRAALRCLIATRTTPAERQAIGRILHRAGLLLREEPGRMQDSPEALSRQFLTASTASDIVAFVECMEVEMRAFLVLAWGLALARAAPGQALPALEHIDADLPYLPPVGPPRSTVPIDGEAFLTEVDETYVEGSFGLSLIIC